MRTDLTLISRSALRCTLHTAGILLPPLQYISHVDKGRTGEGRVDFENLTPTALTPTGGSAWEAGLQRNDRILEVNGSDTRGASHAEVVNLVIKGPSVQSPLPSPLD